MPDLRYLVLALLLPCVSALASSQTLLEQSVGRLGTSTLLEWSQNLDQACAKGACKDSSEAEHSQRVLEAELKNRFLNETGDSFESIPLARWTTLLESRTDSDRCQLLRTAYVLSLAAGTHPNQPLWKLFTHEEPLGVLTRLGHRPEQGASPICPDYFFPESDVLEQAMERGERLFHGSALTAEEAAARARALEKRYLSRGPLSRSPAG